MKFISFSLCISLVTAELHSQLHYYETVKAVDVKVRNKRSLDAQESFTKEVSFSALGRSFNLLLTAGTPVISADFSAKLVYRDGRSSPIYINPNEFYTGHLRGNENIKVDAHEEDGVWEASIYERNETYTLEPSWRYLPPSDNHTMIIYRQSDLKWSNMYPELDNSRERIKTCRFLRPEDDPNFQPALEQQGVSDNRHLEYENYDDEHSRPKRSLWTLNTCHVIAVADYTFFMGPGGGFPHQTANYIVQTMQKVNSLFRRTLWSSEHMLTGLGLQIREMRIHTEHTNPSQYHTNGKHYNMEQSSWPDSALLRQFGQDKDLTNFCLAHLFTHRKFDGGVLGLAYIASPRKFSTGGICSQLGGNKMAYNTGFSTTMNTKGNNMLTQEAVLVTAHEFGHNWGSEHDAETSECAPSSFSKGRFLMYPYAVSGYDENNDDFSPCSKRYVTEVLLAKAGACFKAEKEEEEEKEKESLSNASVEYNATLGSSKENIPLCGNGIIDKGEECDSGGQGISGLDVCCDNFCKLKSGATCSPVNSECCVNCTVARKNTVCRGASKELCLEKALCNGIRLECPASSPLPDSPVIVCMDEGICKNGRCLSYCEKNIDNSKPCRCTTPGEECLRCCQVTNGSCHSVNASDYLTDGRPCSFGYCESGKCVKGRANMIQRLFSFIEKLTPDALVAFMKSNIVGTIIVFSLVVWIPVSWTFSCIDKKREKKSRMFEERWVSSETLLNQSFQSNILANQLTDYKIKEARGNRLGDRPFRQAVQTMLEVDRRKLPPLPLPDPRVSTKYNFDHSPDGPEEPFVRETVM